ncbi:T9SS sorting signal type C domain-containing protein [Flavobacterium defluvii]|nr:T9SS sorting signal type C domain-containing protein [Flavobacterium defluvii]
MFFVFSTANATTYYSPASGSGSPSTLTNWWTNMNSTGSNPANFTTAGDIFIIQNGYTMSTTAAWSLTGSLQIATGGILTVNNNNISITGTTTISGTLNLSNNTGSKTFIGLVTVNSGGTWNNSSSVGVTYRGGITNNGTFTTGTGVQTFDTNAQTLNGTLSIPKLTANIAVSNNGNLTITDTLAGSSSLTNNSGATLNLNTTATTTINTITNSGTTNVNTGSAINTVTANFVNTNTGTLNLNGSGTIAGITNNGTVNLASSGTISTFNNATAASQLNITAATNPITTLTATVTGNTVNYNGTAQTIKATTYSNLTLSGSNTKTLAAATTITSDVNIVSGVILSTSSNNYNLTIGGNFTSSGTFTPGTSTVTLNGVNQSFNVPNFYALTLTGSGTKTFASTGATTISNTLTINSGIIANLGTQTHTANTLFLGSTQSLPGSWGSSSSAATNKSDTYFAATTGQINVSSSTCANFSTVLQITNVSLNTLSKTSTGTTAYEDFTADTPTTITQGKGYSLTVRGNTGGDQNVYYSAFFDWNNDGDFDDAGEYYQIGTIRNSTGTTGAASVYITVPSVATGNIKMRVIGRLSGYNNTPCAISSSSGQMEDYRVTVQSGCTGTAGAPVSSASTVCPNVPFTISLPSSTLSDGATYVWQTSPDNAAWSNATAAPINFFGLEAFNSLPANTNVYGSASVTGNQLLLTPATNSLNGAFVIQNTPGTNMDAFTVNFDYQASGGTGADGFSLSYAGDITSDAAGGESGQGSGIIVQFDTYDNEGVATGSRVRVLYAGNVLFNSAIDVPALRPTTGNTPVVLSVDSKGKLTLRVNGSIVVSDLSLPAAYLSTNKSAWKFKFAARTGGSNDNHIIDNLLIRYQDVVNSNSTFATTQTAKTYYRVQVTCGTTTTTTSVLVDMSTAVITTQPTTPTAVCSGSGVRTISVAATGSGLTYSWRLGGTAVTNGGVISGQGTNTLTLTNPTAANAGSYTVVISDACSTSVTSNAVTVTVNPTPTLTGASQAAAVCAGSSATINLTGLLASSTSTVSYTINGVAQTPITGVTASAGGAASFTSAILTAANNGQTLQITGITNTSNTPNCSQSFTTNVTLAVNPSPTLSGASQAANVCVGSSATINLTGLRASSTSTISYTINGTAQTPITGVTANASGAGSFNTPVLTAANNGQILQITGITTTSSTPNCSQSFTTNVTLAVNPTPTLSGASQAANVCVGSSATINLTGLIASSTSTVSYTINGVAQTPITGVTANASGAASFNTPALTAANNGQTLQITGITTTSSTPNCSQSFTTNVTLAVNPTPTLTGASQAAAVCAGSSATINLTGLLASSTSTVSYTINGVAQTPVTGVIASAGGAASFTTPALTAANNGQTLQIIGITTTSNTPNCSQSFTTNVTLAVNALPVITTHPQTITVCEGKTHTFTVATSAGSPTYQWQYSPNNSTWTNTNGAPGATGHTTASLSVSNIALSYSGYYVRCIVTTGTCSSTSNSALLTVNPTPAAPTASVTTQPTCAAPTGTITISSPAPAAGITYSVDGTTFTNTTGVFTGLAAGPYNVTTKNSSGCESPITVVTINAYAGKTWNGSVSTSWNTAGNWTPSGVPTASDCVTIPDLTAITNKPQITGTNTVAQGYTLNLNNNSLLTVQSTNTLTITSTVTVNTGSTLTFENNASLVQTTNAVNSGNIVYKRDTQPVRRYDFTYWSTPVTSTPAFTLYDLSPTTLADKYYSYDSNTGWVINYNGTLPMAPGKGYIVRAPQGFNINTTAVYSATFTGVPNNGDISFTPVATKWNLIGNPYPSAIDADILINNTGVGALYFWTHNSPPNGSVVGDARYNYTAADYAVYTLTGSTGTASGAAVMLGKIAAGQGFFFKASTASNIVFTNSMRVAGNNSQFFKTAQAKDIEKNRLWLNFANAEGAFKQALIGYIEGATNSFDQNYDAATLNGNTYVDFYSISEAKKLTVQGRAVPFDDAEIIPLGYRTAVAGEFIISIDHTDGLFDNQKVYLEDKVTNTIYDLKAGDYKFTTEIGTFTDRFQLKYTNKTLGTGDFENVKDGLLVSQKNKVINVLSSKENIKEVSVFDINGRLLYNKKKVEALELTISSLQAAEQVLLVKVTLENKAEITRKVIFK